MGSRRWRRDAAAKTAVDHRPSRLTFWGWAGVVLVVVFIAAIVVSAVVPGLQTVFVFLALIGACLILAAFNSPWSGSGPRGPWT